MCLGKCAALRKKASGVKTLAADFENAAKKRAIPTCLTQFERQKFFERLSDAPSIRCEAG